MSEAEVWRRSWNRIDLNPAERTIATNAFGTVSGWAGLHPHDRRQTRLRPRIPPRQTSLRLLDTVTAKESHSSIVDGHRSATTPVLGCPHFCKEGVCRTNSGNYWLFGDGVHITVAESA